MADEGLYINDAAGEIVANISWLEDKATQSGQAAFDAVVEILGKHKRIAPKTKRDCPSCEVEMGLYCSHCQQEFEQ